jgi:lipid-A-disaccharide synthase
MIVTGEVSGDIYGGLLAADMLRLDPGIELSGVGSEKMEEAGVSLFLDSNDLSVMGFWEAIARLRRLRGILHSLQERISRERPDLLILIDYPGMNLRLAKFAHRIGIKVMYYVSPQVWAWGRNRVKAVRDNVDKMVVILPFETDIYEAEGVDVSYVGHPLIDVVAPEVDRDAFRSGLGLEPGRRLVTLLPGSRSQEIRNLTRPLVETAGLLGERFPSTDFVLVTLPPFVDMVRAEAAAVGGGDLRITSEHRYASLKYSDLALTCSGTATLEAALLETPMIVIYKLAFFSWALGKLIVKVPHVSLTNLVAGERLVPEFLQGAVNPVDLAEEAGAILEDDARRKHIVEGLRRIRVELGGGGASERAARLALTLMTG